MSSTNFLQPRATSLRGSDTLSEISDSGTTNSGWASSKWDSREDLHDLVTKIGLKDIADLHQERFRVDRKKLEQMIAGDTEASLPADIFFEQIMHDTSTFIAWPSKLKVGAKTKKDPHIRIAGRIDDVQAAKERIMTVLNSRSNRVIMKIDVSYTDHSHIIGKGGLSIRRVMEETQCHVHFPDSNRSNSMEKSNQVSIAGDIQGAELARSRVRQKMPVVFGFELPIMSQNVDPTCPYIVKTQEQYNVQVMLRLRPKLHATIVLVKGVEWEIEQVKKATILLMEYLCENLANQIPIQMTVEVSPQHHLLVAGKAHSNIKDIMRGTGAQIIFPDAQDPNIPNLKKSNVTITGNIHNVYAARQLILGSLPLILMFDLPENDNLRPEKMIEIQTKYEVLINTRLKTKQTVRVCMIKGPERAATNIYKARNEILGIDDPEVIADIPQQYFLPASQSNLYELPTPTPMNPQPMSPLFSPLISPTWHYPSTSFNSPSPFVGIVKQMPQFVFQQTMSSGYQSLGSSLSSSDHNNRDNFSSVSSSSSISSSVSSPRHRQRNYLPDLDNLELSDTQTSSGYHEDKWSPTFSPTEYEQKRLAGFKAMQNTPNAHDYRYPNNNWAGYGISHTSPLPTVEKPTSTSILEEDNIWSASPKKQTLASPPGLNSSNFLDHTPTNMIKRITTTKWPDLSSLLTSLGLDKYIRLFLSHELDLSTFASITDKDLIEIGVTAFGARRKMLLAISELNKRDGLFLAAPGAERKSSSSSSTTNLNKPCTSRDNW